MNRYFYPNFQQNDFDLLFRKEILKHITSDSYILDLGAGRGRIETLNFRRFGKFVCGIDLNDRVLDNPYLDEAKVANAENIPYKSGYFDLVISNSVLEHLEKPIVVFKEVYRVLKKGGKFIIKTPNKYHYVFLLAKITPMWFHEFYNKFRGVQKSDNFPTFYRINSKKDIMKYGNQVGFEIGNIKLIEGKPNYLGPIPFLYPFGIVYEKIVNKFNSLDNFRSYLIVCLKKNKLLHIIPEKLTNSKNADLSEFKFLAL